MFEAQFYSLRTAFRMTEVSRLSTKRLGAAIGWLALVLGPIGLALAHPFHTSTAEIEFNKQSKRAEVSLKLQVTDIEAALQARAGRRVTLDKTADIDLQIKAFLEANFYLTTTRALEADKLVESSEKTDSLSKVGASDLNSAKATPSKADSKIWKSKIYFVGKEFEGGWLRIYFELEVDFERESKADSVDELILVNRVLVDQNSGQSNSCLVRHHGKRVAFATDRNNSWAKFPGEWLD